MRKDPSAWTDAAAGWDGTETVRRERGERGFAYADWINFDSYIAWVIAGAVEKMKADGHTMFSYPGVPDDEWEDRTNEEYDIMIKGFGNWAEFKFDADERTLYEDLQAALEVFKRRFVSLWD
jgi:hypothetical protein